MSIIARLKEKAFTLYLRHLCSPRRIKNYLRNKIPEHPLNCAGIDLQRIKVAAIQFELRLVSNPEEYAGMMLDNVQKAAAAGAQLIVFPEDNMLQLLGLLPGVADLKQNSAPEAALESLHPGLQLRDIFGFLSPYAESVYHATFSELAKGFGVFILGGSILLKTADNRLISRAFLFNPEGKVVGYQDKSHLLPLEASWGMSCGSDLKVYTTSLGNLAFPICMDATYFETFRILALLGADLIMLPIANPEQYNYWKALRGIWPRVQESYVYGIKSALVGSNFFGFTFTGRSGIYAPLELTPNNDGVLAEASSWDKEEIVLAELDIQALRTARQKAEFFGSWNKELYAHYFPKVYF
ncbi:nitrilase-related carbon-nitrogen hydrolase [Zhaonella formicivorans]|uniref:nitrilase-related carbon-nitrogen hydrolase n=1 Tax=Zhaonella formicivorans TaxID=2528593 RepID=UPI0010E329E9|nr:nitrilase-related carbon-nitrogen hydrolase [Zhaonella formicivorans]